MPQAKGADRHLSCDIPLFARRLTRRPCLSDFRSITNRGPTECPEPRLACRGFRRRLQLLPGLLLRCEVFMTYRATPNRIAWPAKRRQGVSNGRRRILCAGWPSLGPVFFVLLGLVGCRADPNTALLERELRFQEDAIYELEDMLEDHRAALDACQEENAQLRERLGSADGEKPATSDSSVGDWPPPKPKSNPRPTSPEIPNVEMTPPSVEMPEGVSPRKSVPDTLKRFHRPADPSPIEAPEEPGSPAESEDSQAPPPPRRLNLSAKSGATEKEATEIIEPVASQAAVESIALGSRLTGGYDADGNPGDEGICVCLHPENSSGEFLPVAAPVSVALLDPAEQGDAARVARWDFTAEEVGSAYRRSSLGQGAYLAMLWPNEAPRRDRLHLFVRLTTEDGRKLQIDQPIAVALAEPATRRWASSEGGSTVEGPALRPPGSQWKPTDLPDVANDEAHAEATAEAASVDDNSQAEADPGRQEPEPRRRPMRLSSRLEGSSTEPPPRRRPTWSPYRP